MASDLLSIASSGARAARSALDVTGQNIANAASAGYVRRSISQTEVSSAGSTSRIRDISLSGVRVTGMERHADLFRQAEVRRTGSDAARAASELAGLESVELAIEQARPFDRIVDFETALQRLSADPTDPSLRAAVLSAASGLADAIRLADTSLGATSEGLGFEAGAQVDEINLFGSELARINLKLARASVNGSEGASLLDQRDSLLEQLSARSAIATSFAADGSVTVRLGDASGPVMVQGAASGTLAMTSDADGTIGFALDGAPLVLHGGSLAGKARALDGAAQARSGLDALASGIISTVNSAQAAGVDLAGAGGAPMFTGTNARSMALALTNGNQIATAPAGSGPGSANPDNLDLLRAAFGADGHADAANALLFTVSSAVSSRRVSSEAMGAIAGSARAALDQQAGVDLDHEAANLLRFQQAFQASARAMQTATEVFDTLLGIGR